MANQHRQFLSLFLQNQRVLAAYIRTLVPNKSDADDVMQEVAATLWEKFDTFQSGTNFNRWSFRVAKLTILSHLRDRGRSRVIPNEELLRQVASVAAEQSSLLEDRHQALQSCLQKLSEADRKIILMRYAPGSTNRLVADALGLTESSISRALNRIRFVLLGCVNATLATCSRRWV